jgi:hypothetical protein
MLSGLRLARPENRYARLPSKTAELVTSPTANTQQEISGEENGSLSGIGTDTRNCTFHHQHAVQSPGAPEKPKDAIGDKRGGKQDGARNIQQERAMRTKIQSLQISEISTTIRSRFKITSTGSLQI